MKNKILQSPDQAITIPRSNPLVLVTGSFDVVHLGHLEFLEKAKESSPDSILLVILLSDENIRSRKGDSRPINNQDMRTRFLQYIDLVDYILIWEKAWQELRDFVKQLKPEFLVVNSDDSGLDNKKEIVNSYGGKLIVYDKKRPISTSEIISKIISLD